MLNVKLSLGRCHFGSRRSHASLSDVGLNTNNGEVGRKFKIHAFDYSCARCVPKANSNLAEFVKFPIVYQVRV